MGLSNLKNFDYSLALKLDLAQADMVRRGGAGKAPDAAAKTNEIEPILAQFLVDSFRLDGFEIANTRDIYQFKEIDQHADILIDLLRYPWGTWIKSFIAANFRINKKRIYFDFFCSQFLTEPAYNVTYLTTLANVILRTSETKDLNLIRDVIIHSSCGERMIIAEFFKRRFNKNPEAFAALKELYKLPDLQPWISSWKNIDLVELSK